MSNTFFQDLFNESEEIMILNLNGINNILDVRKVAEMIDRQNIADEELKNLFLSLKKSGGDCFRHFKYMVELYIQAENFKNKAN